MTDWLEASGDNEAAVLELREGTSFSVDEQREAHFLQNDRLDRKQAFAG